MTRKELIRRLDSICSSYVIARDGACVTSGAVKNLTCSHLIRRGKQSIRWMEANLFCQSASENRKHDEDDPASPLYTVFLSRYSIVQLAQLKLKARELSHFKEPHLQMMLANWERKLTRILEETGQTLEEVNQKKYHPDFERVK